MLQMKKFLPLMLLAMLTLTYCKSAIAEPRFLRSSYNLEDPNGYCLDIPGFGARLQKEGPITTHTCKYDRPGFWVDELFEVTQSNQLRLSEYGLCLSASAMEPSADIDIVDCAADGAHAWTMHSSERVTPAGVPALCMTMSSKKVYVNSTIANLTPNSTRSVSLENCASALKYRQSWKWSDPDELKTLNANTLRAGMDAKTAAGIRELGNEVKPQETAELYATLPRMFTSSDVSVSEIIDYGPEEGQQLQVYTGVHRNHPRDAAPIILLVHGGAFTGGGLRSLANAAIHFAGLGYIAVNMTYPLAPRATWPSGGQSVASAVSWIKESAAEIKGNPDNIFVLGLSAGGTHVADFVFRPEIVGGESPQVAGAILASPALALDPENPGGPAVAYFGEASDEWWDKQVLGNIERTSIPVLIMTAELDPDRFKISSAKLLHELVVDKGIETRIKQMRGHNHISYIYSIGTPDTQAAQEIIDFMATAGRD
jgi:triacylglycerol lipase